MFRNARLQAITVKAKRGFTLIELMAATALMMFLVAIVLSMTGNIMTAWNRAYSQLTANFSARQAMGIIALDLESAIIKANSSSTDEISWMEIYTSTDDDTLSAFGRFDHIFFYSQTNLRQKYYNGGGGGGGDFNLIPGDICAIAYRIGFINPLDPGSNKDKRFVFYRAVVDPLATFTNFLGIDQQRNLDETWRSGSYKENLIDKFHDRNYSGGGWDYASETMNLLALNVVALEFEPVFKTAEPGAEVIYSSDLDAEAHRFPPRQNEMVEFRSLQALDITMIVISNEGEAIIRNLATANQLTQAKFEDLIYTYDQSTGAYELGKHAERFKQRVKILTRPR